MKEVRARAIVADVTRISRRNSNNYLCVGCIAVAMLLSCKAWCQRLHDLAFRQPGSGAGLHPQSPAAGDRLTRRSSAAIAPSPEAALRERSAAGRGLGDLEVPPAPFEPPASYATAADPFTLSLSADLQLIMTGLMVSSAPKLVAPSDESPLRFGPLLPWGINALDRTVVGNRSATAGTVSDISLAASVGLPFALSALDALLSRPDQGLLGLGKDSIVLLETFAVTGILSNIVKFAVRRARPYTYDPSTEAHELTETDADLSFFSGHTSFAFAMATAYSSVFATHHPDSLWQLPVWLGTHALASTTAVMRVMAGKHFWTDVITGAAVGSAIGALVPFVHRVRSGYTFLADARIIPFFRSGGMGANVMLIF